MPKKGKSSIGRKTSAANHKSKIRADESAEVAAARLKRNAEYIQELRQNETQEQHTERIESQKRQR